ncbi:phosphatidylinositol-specific phospholipase C domain-containing protein [Tenacibaculum sp. Ill]|uniref:phosphatidylinositol-specific phospholipase C domain-containing protein n=1 Tax=Tenacibaculum sp. Ill TaxID=3445935 RepID=UPI003F7A1230
MKIRYSLKRGEFLKRGECITSTNGDYTLTLQHDGNLVHKSRWEDGDHTNWNAGTNPDGVKAIMQGDGNFVVYDKHHNDLWDSGTDGEGEIVVCKDKGEDKGRVVIYDRDGENVWDTPQDDSHGPGPTNSFYVEVKIDNTDCPYDLFLDRKWGERTAHWKYDGNDFSVIKSGINRTLYLLNSDRGGLSFYCLPYGNGRRFYMNMAFTNPKCSRNNAEGSQFTGLQKYSTSGHPLKIRYKIGTPNLAGWENNEVYTPKRVCHFSHIKPKKLPKNSKVSIKNARVKIVIDNSLNHHPMYLQKIWNRNGKPIDKNWSEIPTNILPKETKTFYLNTKNTAGLHYKTANLFSKTGKQVDMVMAFYHPSDKSGKQYFYGEGSQMTGLRAYKTQTKHNQVEIKYQIFSQNTAFWYNGSTYPLVRRNEKHHPKKFPNWMESNKEILKSKKLYEICIPGSHDSTTYTLGRIGWSPPQFGIAKCQSENIEKQLELGVRLFDLRLIWYNDQIYLHHGDYTSNDYYTIPFKEAIKAFSNFLKKHTKEIIFLMFWQRPSNKNGEYWSAEHDEETIKIIKNEFEKKLIIENEVNNTFEEFLNKRKNVLIFYNNYNKKQEKYNFLHPLPSASHEGASMTTEAIFFKTYNGLKHKNNDKFFISQAQGTPNGPYTPNHINVGSGNEKQLNKSEDIYNPYLSYGSYSSQYDPAMVDSLYFGPTIRIPQWIREEWWNSPINFMWVDFVEQSDFVQACIERNFIS